MSSGGTRTSAGIGRVSVHAGSVAATTKEPMTSVLLIKIRMASPVHRGAQAETDSAQVLSRKLRVEHVHEPPLQRQPPLEVRVEAALQIEGVALVAGEHAATLAVDPD